MKDKLKKWLSDKSGIRGLLGSGVYFPDQSVLSHSAAPEYSSKSMENAWRCLSETFQAFKTQEIPSKHVKWIYENATLHGSMRSDGVCLGVFTRLNQEDYDSSSVVRMIQEFQQLK
jgi:hypothetical protein